MVWIPLNWMVRQDDSPEYETSTITDERVQIENALRDRQAFAPLYRKYATPVYRYFYQGVNNTHDAEDLTASTFSKALAGLERYQSRGSFSAWLFGIARHTLIDHQRARYTTGGELDVERIVPEPIDPTPSPEKVVLEHEQALHLRRLVANLPTEQREAIALRIYGELRIKDIGILLGKSDGAVKMLVHRAVETLRAQYGLMDNKEVRNER